MRRLLGALGTVLVASIVTLACHPAWAVEQVPGKWLCEQSNPTRCESRPAEAARPVKAPWTTWGKEGWDLAKRQCEGMGQYDQVDGSPCWFIALFISQCEKTKITAGMTPNCARAGLQPPRFASFVSAVVANREGLKECKVFVDAFSGFKVDTSHLPKAKSQRVDDARKKLADLQQKVDAKFGIDSAALAQDLQESYKAYDDASGKIEAAEKVGEFAALMNKVGGWKKLATLGNSQPKLVDCIGLADEQKCIGAYSDSGQILIDANNANAIADYMNTTGVATCLIAVETVKQAMQ